MDLLIIPVLLSTGGALIYLGIHGLPRLSPSQLPLRPDREPFNLTDWIKARAAGGGPAYRGAEYDAELVELMNEMIAVRDELSGLKLAIAARDARRGTAPAQVEAKTRAGEGVTARRQSYNGAGRRYIRT